MEYVKMIEIAGYVILGLWGAYSSYKKGKYAEAHKNTTEALDWIITGLEMAPKGKSSTSAKEAVTFFRQVYSEQGPKIEEYINSVKELLSDIKGQGEDSTKLREAAEIVKAARNERKLGGLK